MRRWGRWCEGGGVAERRKSGQGRIFGSESSKLMSSKGQRLLTHTERCSKCLHAFVQRDNELSWLSRTANERDEDDVDVRINDDFRREIYPLPKTET